METRAEQIAFLNNKSFISCFLFILNGVIIHVKTANVSKCLVCFLNKCNYWCYLKYVLLKLTMIFRTSHFLIFPNIT